MSITYLEAIREAQAKLLRDDERVFIYGQDVGGSFGGAFKATKGLAKEFPGRVLNTPISEDAMVGTAIGAAIEGMRPIVEMQFADFSSIASQSNSEQRRDALLAHAIFRVRSRCGCPRGGTKGSGPFHSANSMESLYAHYPGLIVMTPATVEDAYTMLLDAVAIDDPVIYCEHKYLYYHLKADSFAERRNASRQSSNRAAGTRSDHRQLQRDGARIFTRSRRNCERRIRNRSGRSAHGETARYRHRAGLRRANRPTALRSANLSPGAA